jgi:hypothetical protein
LKQFGDAPLNHPPEEVYPPSVRRANALRQEGGSP